MRNILFILLLCNVMLLKAQSLELEHWRIINSSEIADADAKVSQPSYPTTGWYQATVPTTVLNALVKENVYPDPRIGLNNYLIPDVSDEFNARMDLDKYNYLKSGRNPWQDPYWYRTEITLPKSYKGKYRSSIRRPSTYGVPQSDIPSQLPHRACGRKVGE